MATFTVYFEVSVNSNIENRREKFIILISILYPIDTTLITSRFLLCFLRELLVRFLIVNISWWDGCQLTMINRTLDPTL